MIRSVGGYHFLYADTFLTREEFEEMFDLTAYELVRKKYHAEGRENLVNELHGKEFKLCFIRIVSPSVRQDEARD